MLSLRGLLQRSIVARAAPAVRLHARRGAAAMSSAAVVPVVPPAAEAAEETVEGVASLALESSESLLAASPGMSNFINIDLEGARAALEAGGVEAIDPDRTMLTQGMMTLLNGLHDVTGAPYWAVIIGATLAFRSLAFPLYVSQIRNGARMTKMQPEMKALQASAMQDKTPEGMMYARKQMSALYKKHDVKMSRMLIPLVVQMPLFISFYVGLRGLCEDFTVSLSTGGTAWFPSLVASDTTFALPLLSAATMLASVEANKATMPKPMVNVMRGMSAVVLGFTYDFPAAILCYWATNNFFSFGQSMVMKSEAVKRALNIPIVKPAKPASSFAEMMKNAGMPGGEEDAASGSSAKLPPASTPSADAGPVTTFKHRPTAAGGGKKKRGKKNKRGKRR
eukprot:PLAT15909.1.p1 GENE.PLAT15909.1~~PLAT15909.1.p1  ORF type:complete len:394 (+),score=168.78 PLAT15909.1:3-1184(+)